ncbi:probable 3-hydroxyisobutyrate dehydrogenase, mitochondrial isoform X4 [Henckelia pumila]|uniref:probable 3-hydroxyisobutyrate dehydrogenase, mitochondrial isoform X4 n=1 Tax=Henckelia pumila TaxID=405737 RepID=UPI003C6DBDCD
MGSCNTYRKWLASLYRGNSKITYNLSWARMSSSSLFSSQFERVGFVGLGNMGSRMANNLIKAGYNVLVHDVNLDVMKKYSDNGILTKNSPFDVAEECDVVITMLPSSTHEMVSLLLCWMHLYLAVFYQLRLGRSLSWLVAQSKHICLQSPCFSQWAKTSRTVVAQEMAAKICNNLALAVSMLGVSEAFALGQSLGISAHTLANIFNSSSARCWSSDTYNPVPGVMDEVPASRNYEGGFAAKLMAKDLGLAAVSAKEVGLSSPLTFLAERIFTELCNEGHGTKDFSCVFRHYFSGKDE